MDGPFATVMIELGRLEATGQQAHNPPLHEEEVGGARGLAIDQHGTAKSVQRSFCISISRQTWVAF